MLAAILPPTTARARRRALTSLGLLLARYGVMAKASLVIAALTVLGALLVTVSLMRHGNAVALDDMPSLTASALAWGAGVLLAFAASVQVFKRDREGGVTALLRARGASPAGYLWTRVGGLTLLLVVVVGGGTLVVGVAGMLVAARAGAAVRALQCTGAALVYAVAFSITMGPLAMAALGARSRAGGYLWLVLVLVVPELIAPVTVAYLPSGFRELTSIPGALAALRSAIMPPGVDSWRALKALFVLAIVIATSLAVVRGAARVARKLEAP